MKAALVSTGLGRVLRGFESFTESLFAALRQYAPVVDVTLFQGGGASGELRRTVPNFHRYDAPARWLGYDKGNLLEKRSFALALYPILRREKFDIVHYNELTMGSALYHLRRLFGGTYKLLYCGGSTWSPAHYGHRCDFAQLLTGPQYQQAIEFGLARRRLFLIPYGLDPDRFSPKTHAQRGNTRRELGIPEDVPVILTVAILDRQTKRIDYLIKELSTLGRDVWLLAAGQFTDETPALEREAKHLLNGRCRFISWPSEKVPFLYGAADIFVLSSLVEAFGRVTVEAFLTGLPAVIHNGPVFRWVAEGTSAHTIDMSAEGELTRTLRSVLTDHGNGNSRGVATKRFSWEELVPTYADMYHRIAQC
jgi:glycosyltransferase involved in cell wall biosynthesis